MRRYLALQAIESGKGLGRELIGRSAFAYGSGMLLGGDSSSSKVGQYNHDTIYLNPSL